MRKVRVPRMQPCCHSEEDATVVKLKLVPLEAHLPVLDSTGPLMLTDVVAVSCDTKPQCVCGVAQCQQHHDRVWPGELLG